MEASEITHVPGVIRKGLTGINYTSPKYKVIIIDGMVLVYAMPVTERIMLCEDFAELFLDQLTNMAGDDDEVRLVVDGYINTFLKEQMERKRTKGTSTYESRICI